MSPSHVKKKDGRRYRYYISQALLQHRASEAGSLSRVPGTSRSKDSVEDRIERLSRCRQNGSTDATSAAAAVRDPLSNMFDASRSARSCVSLSLTDEALRERPRVIAVPTEPTDVMKETGDTFSIRDPDPAQDLGRREDHRRTELALRRSWKPMSTTRWSRHSCAPSHGANNSAEGSVRSLENIANREHCTEAYVRQIIELAFLAPDIIERILAGTQPRHITIDRLARMTIPLSWRDQRRQFGLDSGDSQSQNRSVKPAAGDRCGRIRR